MKVNKLASITGKKSKVLIQEINDPRVTHHNHEVPEDILALYDVEEKKIEETRPEPKATVDISKGLFVNTMPSKEECTFTIEEIELGIRCLGSKGKHWEWRHLLDG